jgi:hypothetical protein
VFAPEAGSWVAATTVRALRFFIGSAFFLRATFFAPARLGLDLAKDFLLFGLAAIRLAALPFTDLKFLRALARAVDFPIRAVARFFL